MSSIANWSYTSTATIWPKGAQDEFGDFSWGEPYTVKASWMRGGKDKYTDNHGIEFTPMITVWTEFIDVASGDVAATRHKPYGHTDTSRGFRVIEHLHGESAGRQLRSQRLSRYRHGSHFYVVVYDRNRRITSYNVCYTKLLRQ